MLIKNNNFDEKRLLDPDVVHKVWFCLINLLIDQNQAAPFDYGSSVRKKDLIDCLKNSSKNGKESVEKDVAGWLEQATKENFVKLFRKHKSKLEETLTNGIVDQEDDEKDDLMVSLPDGGNVFHPSHDWYCFQCHRITTTTNDECSQLIECPKCWRTYHQKCVQTTAEFVSFSNDPEGECFPGTNLPSICPICKLIGKYSEYKIGSRRIDPEEFNEILSYTYKSFREKCRQISHSLRSLLAELDDDNVAFLTNLVRTKIAATSPVVNGSDASNVSNNIQNMKDVITKLSIYYLSYKPVAIGIVEEKLSLSQYKTIGEFFADCLNVKHLVELVICASAEHHQTSVVGQKRIREALLRTLNETRYEVKEMIHCVDCYRNSNRQEDKYWFCFPCDPPHALVFAKQKGWPYWPAKVINPRNVDQLEQWNNQLDVRFFGTNHQRSLIDRTNVKDINSALSELNIVKRMQSLEKALSELRIHRELLDNNKKVGNGLKNQAKAIDGEKLTKSDQNDGKCNSKLVVKTVNGELGQSLRKMRKSNRMSDENDNDNNDDTDMSGGELNEYMTEDTDTDDHTEMEEDVEEEKVKQFKKQESDEVLADDDNSVSSNNHRTASSNIITTPQKRKNRGRPKKIDNRKKRKFDPVKMETTNRIRRRKVIYSPHSQSQEPNSSDGGYYQYRGSAESLGKTSQVSSSTKTLKRNNKKSPLMITHSSETKMIARDRVRQKPKKLLSYTTFSPVTMSTTSNNNTQAIKTTSQEKRLFLSANDSISPNSSKSRQSLKPSNSVKYLKKKREIEREKELIKARRKLLQTEIQTPKHIPPVVATKSTPTTISPTKPMVVDTPIMKTEHLVQSAAIPAAAAVAVQSNLSPAAPPINGYANYGYITTATESAGFTIKSEMDTNAMMVNNDDGCLNKNPGGDAAAAAQQIDLLQTEPMMMMVSEDYKPPPSSILKPLNSEGETDEDKADDECVGKSGVDNLNMDQALNNNKDLTKETADYEDDDEEPYLYDDEQLEEHINYYMEYQKEKELEQQHRQLNHHHMYHQPELFAAHQQQLNVVTTAAASSSSSSLSTRLSHTGLNSQLVMIPRSLDDRTNAHHYHHHHHNNYNLDDTNTSNRIPNGFVEPPESFQKYIDFSKATVYAPTKKNQNIVHAYLHHMNNSKIPNGRNDYLATFIPKKEEFIAEETAMVSPKKRGRPLKNTEPSPFDYNGKARCVLEKSYLQDTACNRACLTNNVKAFKRFREYVEVQGKNEICKLKRELEESKQQVYRLQSKNDELEKEIKIEKDLNKRFDPALLIQMEAKHKRELSEVKRKHWCTICEAEATHFCCFRTNYCSPQCQMNHWNAGHKNECLRNNSSNYNNNKCHQKSNNNQPNS